MKIFVRIVGTRRVPIELPEGTAVPRVGEQIAYLRFGPNEFSDDALTVTSVTHYPFGEVEDDEVISEPYVYVVVEP